MMVGVQVSETEDLPGPILAKVLPAGQYAAHTLGGERMTGNSGETIYREWLPSSAYWEAYSCIIGRHDEDHFRGWGDPESRMEVWVPIKARYWTTRVAGREPVDDRVRAVLDGVNRWRLVDPMYEHVRIVLGHPGENVSPAYMQGISGVAFRMGGICPSP
jgi:hypothetical protein